MSKFLGLIRDIWLGARSVDSGDNYICENLKYGLCKLTIVLGVYRSELVKSETAIHNVGTECHWETRVRKQKVGVGVEYPKACSSTSYCVSASI